MMYDNTEKLPRAILAAVDTGEYDAETSLLELEELARTAGVEVAATSIQKRPAPDSATVVGSGRLRELTEDLERLEADMLIFDCELTGSQTRNIGDVTGVAVVDRTMLILDIFAASGPGAAKDKLQVELAQLRYLSATAGRAAARTSPGWAAASAPGAPVKPSWKPTAGISAPAIQKLEEELRESHPPPGTAALPPQKGRHHHCRHCGLHQCGEVHPAQRPHRCRCAGGGQALRHPRPHSPGPAAPGRALGDAH